MKLKYKFLTAVSALAMGVPLIATVTACSQKTDYSSLANMLQKDAYEEFLMICPIYRPTFKTRKICDYLKKRVAELGLGDSIKEDKYRAIDEKTKEESLDSSGNLTFEIPATPGCENVPKVILQGHMDMVCKDNGSYDWETYGVIPVEENGIVHSKNNKTSLGADDGAGIGLILAIAKNRDAFAHGPIRAIITADEEDGVSGASEISVDWLDADFLVNVDGENETDMVTSCAGAQECKFEHAFTPYSVTSADPQYKITISGLSGGHSGLDMGVNRANAIVLMAQLIQYIENAPSGYNIKLSHAFSPGSYTSIPSEITFYIITNTELKTLETDCQLFQKYSMFMYPIEKNLSIKVTEPSALEKMSYSLNSQDTAKLVEYLTLLPYGPLSYNLETGEIETSCNIGGFTGACSESTEIDKSSFCIEPRTIEQTDMMHVEFGIQGRSSNTDHLGPKPSPTSMWTKGFLLYFANITDHIFTQTGEAYTDYIQSASWIPPWPYNPTKLWDLLQEGAKENKNPISQKNVLAWAETAYFATKKPTIHIANVGAQINNPHNVTENLVLDSLTHLAFNIVYMLMNISKIQEAK